MTTDEYWHTIAESYREKPQEPFEDAISRRAVLDLAVKIELPDSQTFFCISPEDVEALPSVTPQPKTGHWILRDDINGQYQCDECGMFSGLSKFDVEEAGWKLSNFCSNCGAKMIEPQESEEISREEIAALLARESEEQA